MSDLPHPLLAPDGVPFCAYEKCVQFDGKRCRMTGSEPRGICDPYVQDMVATIRILKADDQRLRDQLAQATKERDHWRAAAAKARDGYGAEFSRAKALEEERDAAIARAETILADRDLAIRRIAELTERAEKAERERDQALETYRYMVDSKVEQRIRELEAGNRQLSALVGLTPSWRENVERSTVEAIAARLETWLDDRHGGLVELTPGQAAYEDGFNAAVEQVRAWRKESDRG